MFKYSGTGQHGNFHNVLFDFSEKAIPGTVEYGGD